MRAPVFAAAAVRAAIKQVNPDEPIRRAGPLQNMVEESIAKRKFALYLLGAFGCVAVLLTSIGVYGVISYSLRRRANEFAIRLAMGAGRADLRWLIARNFGAPALGGLLVGLGMAALFARALKSQLYKLSPTDPSVLAMTGVGLLALVVISATGPAAKAERISPARILRD